jgi:hypothetical protein
MEVTLKKNNYSTFLFIILKYFVHYILYFKLGRGQSLLLLLQIEFTFYLAMCSQTS